MKRTATFLSVLLVLALMLTGCGLAKKPVPSEEPPVPPNAGTPPTDQGLTMAVFFSDWQAQHLIPEPRLLPKAEGAALANQVVKELLAGPTDPHLHRTLPAEIKLLEPVTVRDGVAYVNLSKELLNVRGSAGVAMALGSLRLSLTEVPGVSKVQVLVEGKANQVMDHGSPLGPLDRGFWGDVTVLPDPERAKYLQGRVAQGLDTWRLDAAKVLQWEGRMFGFTAAELAAAEVKVEGNAATARVEHSGKFYSVRLERTAANGVWTIAGAEAVAAFAPLKQAAVFFGDSQAQHLIPEVRTLPANLQTDHLPDYLVQALLGGPWQPHMHRTLPEGVKLLEPVRLEGDLATVNLSKELLKVQGAAGESMALNSLVYTLTELPGIRRVQILVEGKKGETLEHTVLDRPLTRGINAAPVLVDMERAKYLAQRSDSETWRRDPVQMLQWEGRMFGFTADELKTAKVEAAGSKGTATLTKGSAHYRIDLERFNNGTNPPIWLITGITESR